MRSGGHNLSNSQEYNVEAPLLLLLLPLLLEHLGTLGTTSLVPALNLLSYPDRPDIYNLGVTDPI